ncbi:adenosylcobinamide-phosphate synthase CbiB [Ectobacillus funiculus]|uniref:adenosylcobinamide-phosphate synthase CbiB n=1 Tax=Ectobacillus funiculus TaxID=137993 RepID=UPI00101D02CE|nr:adenosylcobinamide-phosphate synthase CbiB [Ectobacillus funiculus]
MFTNCICIGLAYIVDRLIGDPRVLPHPVIMIGKCIALLEKIIRRLVVQERMLKLAGILFPLLIGGGAFFVVTLLLDILRLWSGWLGFAAEVWIVSTTIAVKGLGDAAMEVYRHLQNGDFQKARHSLGMIVGRDTADLDESEISRGAVETVAENIVDAIISPLFFALIGGAPLAMAYRAVNTLDSMVGYKNEAYRNLGWASARMDDVMNYIPARLTGVLIMVTCFFMRLNVRRAWTAIRRDAKLHPSPNSGIPEAAVAGALGIQLGGTNFYQGIPSHRAKMGEPLRLIQKQDIILTVRIMNIAATICVAVLCVIGVLFVI